MGGVAAAAQGGGIGLQLGGRAMAIQVEARTLQVGIGRTLQLLQGHGHLVGVAQQAVAIPVGQVHRLHQAVDRGRTIGTGGFQLEGLQHIEQLQQGDAPGTGGRHGHHLITAEAPEQRGLPTGPIGR